MAKNKRDRAREKRWRGLLAAQRKSGLGVRAFCARERVTEPSFYAWRRAIGVRDGRVLRLPPGLPPARVTELVRAIEAAS
jgi:hypothetical protein